MTPFIDNIKKWFSDSLAFSICYFIAFLLLLETFSDSSQTTNMFLLIDFLTVILLTIYYLATILAGNFINRTFNVCEKGMLLFITAQLSVLTITGYLPILELFKGFLNDQIPHDQIYLFRRNRDLAFLITGLMSSIVYVAINYRTKNNIH